MPISKNDKETLEEAALAAFAGKMSTLREGLEFRNEFGPLATVFWSRMPAGVEVEITLADNRLSERYKLDSPAMVEAGIARSERAEDRTQ